MKQKFTESYKKDYLDVGDGHRMYYELYGNPKGKPVLFLHGGPGAGFDEKYKVFFNPKVWNVIFYDQRGAGKSTPFASLENNKTQNLVSDINKLLNHLGIEKAFLFGGSWGATLGLIYAIQNPEKVTGMLLRGIFLCNERDNKHFLGDGIRSHFPELWDRFMSFVPEGSRNDAIGYYLYQMMHATDPKTRDKFAYEWSYYESAILKMQMTGEEIKKDLSEDPYLALSIIEAYYMKNLAFIPENFILDNASKLSNLPVSIVHGRYDFICPPINAYDLHKKIDGSALCFVFGGHSGSEPEIEKKLIEEMMRFEKVV